MVHPILYLTLVVVQVFSQSFNGKTWPGTKDDETWTVVVKSPVTVCEDEASQNFWDASQLKTINYNQTASWMEGNAIFYKGMSDAYGGQVILDKQIGNQFTSLFTNCIDVCKELLLGPDSDYYFLLKYFESDGCPFEAGSIPIQRTLVDTSSMPLSRETAGCYKATINIIDRDCDAKDKNILACATGVFCVEPAD